MSRSTADMATGIFVLLVAGIFHLQSGDLEGVSLLFPQMLLIFLSLGGLIVFIQGLLKHRKGQNAALDEEPVAVRQVIYISLGSIVYIGLIPILGFYPASAIFLFCMGMWLSKTSQGTRKTALAASLFTIVLCFSVWLGFAVLLHVPTPQSILFNS